MNWINIGSTGVAEHRFDEVLAIVKRAVNRQIVDIVGLHGGHLQALHLRDPAVRVHDEDGGMELDDWFSLLQNAFEEQGQDSFCRIPDVTGTDEDQLLKSGVVKEPQNGITPPDRDN